MTYIRLEPSVTRLGNWMFQYAAAKSAANGGEVSFVIRKESERQAVERFRKVFPDVTIVPEAPAGAEVMEGLFQDVKYLNERIVRSLFRARDDYAGCVDPGTVSIHVRRGDYLRLPHRHPFVGARYLREAVSRFPAETRFLVFSDDLNWCRRFFTGERFRFSDGKDVVDDLFRMSWCDHHICSNSTFSWWGAYLRGSGRTLFPSRWFGPAITAVDWRGLYYPGCEVIENRPTLALRVWTRALMAKTSIGNVLRRVGLR